MQADSHQKHSTSQSEKLKQTLGYLILRSAQAFEPKLAIPRRFVFAMLPSISGALADANAHACEWLADNLLLTHAEDPNWLVMLPTAEEISIGAITDELIPGMSIQDTAECAVESVLAEVMQSHERELVRDLIPQALYVTERALETESPQRASLCAQLVVALTWLQAPQADRFLKALLELDAQQRPYNASLVGAHLGIQAIVEKEHGRDERSRLYEEAARKLMGRSRQA